MENKDRYKQAEPLTSAKLDSTNKAKQQCQCTKLTAISGI